MLNLQCDIVKLITKSDSNKQKETFKLSAVFILPGELRCRTLCWISWDYPKAFLMYLIILVVVVVKVRENFSRYCLNQSQQF